MRLPSVICLTSALVLGACQEQAPPQAATSAPQAKGGSLAPSEVRACDSGASVATEGQGQGQIKMTYKAQVLTLDQVPTGQGQHYRGGGADWTVVSRDGQEIATLTMTSPEGKQAVVETCRRPAAQLAQTPKSGAMSPCISPDLTYGVEMGDAAMGHRLTTIRVDYRGRVACQLEGAPSVTLIGEDGKPLDHIKAEATNEGYFGRVRAGVPVILKSGEQAYFDIGWSVVPNEASGEKVCPKANSVRLAPPGDNGGKALALAITPCGGKVEVSHYRVVADRQAASSTAP